jgi:hypothetical protein
MITPLNLACLRAIAQDCVALDAKTIEELPEGHPLCDQLLEISAMDRARVEGYVTGYLDHVAALDDFTQWALAVQRDPVPGPIGRREDSRPIAAPPCVVHVTNAEEGRHRRVGIAIAFFAVCFLIGACCYIRSDSQATDLATRKAGDSGGQHAPR